MGKFVHMDAPKDKAIGFCRLHKRYMSIGQMRKKECRKKECHWFRKNMNHPWWVRKEKIKEIRKNEHRNNDGQNDKGSRDENHQ